MCVLASERRGKENRVGSEKFWATLRHQLAAYKTWPVLLISRVDFADHNMGEVSEFGSYISDICFTNNIQNISSAVINLGKY